MAENAINSYQDLHVWQDAMTLAEECYRASQHFPKEELFGMTSQVRRAAASIPANIAEGHGRETTGSFVQSLRVAQGSLKELETHLLLAQRVNLVDATDADILMERCTSLGKRIRSLIRSLQAKRP